MSTQSAASAKVPGKCRSLQIYPWVLFTTLGNFYNWLRSRPFYDASGNKWRRGAAVDEDSALRFYQAGEREYRWATRWNAFIDALENHVDVKALLEEDRRYYVQKDTKLNYEKYKSGTPNPFYKLAESSFPISSHCQQTPDKGMYFHKYRGD